MALLNKVPKGADLTKPRLSGGWLIGATIGIVVLMAAWGVGSWLYGKARGAAAPIVGATSGTAKQMFYQS